MSVVLVDALELWTELEVVAAGEEDPAVGGEVGHPLVAAHAAEAREAKARVPVKLEIRDC